jgi:hypothetical protein
MLVAVAKKPPSFTYALLQIVYEAMIALKVHELEQAELPPAVSDA